MGHNDKQVLLGTTRSNVKEVTNAKGAINPGVFIRQKSDGTLSTIKADGLLLGVSLGIDLSDTNKTAIVRKGLLVPAQLKVGFNPTVGAVVEVDDATGLAAGDGTRTAVNAVYATGRLGGSGYNGGISESGGAAVGVALIDFPGGL
jgi:hypothetical protein